MIILTNNQIEEMAYNICNSQDGDLIINFDGNEVEVKYYLDYDKDYEDETGACNIKDVEFSVYDVINFGEEIYFDEYILGNMVIDYLTA